MTTITMEPTGTSVPDTAAGDAEADTGPVEARPTRRRLLLGGAAMAVAATAVDLARTAAETPTLATDGRTTVMLDAVDVRREVLGRERMMPLRGDTVLTTGTLLLDGTDVGELTFTEVHLARQGRSAQGRSSSTGQHVLHLDDGTIVGAGAATPDDEPDEYAVVGGTGRYRGVTGSYVLQFHPGSGRPDGAATLILDLHTPEATHGA